MSLVDRARGIRKPGLTSTQSSVVRFPSCVFALEKHGIFPLERFAYDSLRIGVEATNSAGVPDALEVNFEADPLWWLGASVQQSASGNGAIRGYRIDTSPLTPYLLYALSVRTLRVQDTIGEAETEVAAVRANFQELKDILSATSTAFLDGGLGPALLTLRDDLGMDIQALQRGASVFDGAVKVLVGHEFAHAYIERFPWANRDLSPTERKAYEIMADLVAVSWLYSAFVRNTPDSVEYRKQRGFASHGEAIRNNSAAGLLSIKTFLMTLGLASALHGDSGVSLKGGVFHPHSLIRYLLQDVHFVTLAVSNFPDAFTDGYAESFRAEGFRQMGLLVRAGLVPDDDIRALTDDANLEPVRLASKLIAEHDIPELFGPKDLLANLTAFKKA